MQPNTIRSITLEINHTHFTNQKQALQIGNISCLINIFFKYTQFIEQTPALQ